MTSASWMTRRSFPARRRVQEELEHTPAGKASAKLEALYEAMNAEFLRRARTAWEAQ